MAQTTQTTIKVYLNLNDGRRYASAPGAPPAPVYSDLAQNATAYCECGAKIRLEATVPGSHGERLMGLEYALHFAGEHA